jgi:hypothetical protein
MAVEAPANHLKAICQQCEGLLGVQQWCRCHCCEVMVDGFVDMALVDGFVLMASVGASSY